MTNRAKWLSATLGLAAILLLAGRAQADTFTYQISVNTSSVLGTSGYLDFQFNPGNPPTDLASATLTDFTSDATLTGPLLLDFGAVTGTLPGTVEIDNTFVNNEHTEGVTYGSFFDVFVTLDIPTVSGTATSGSSFALSVWDTSFESVLTGDPLVEIDLDATTGNPSVTNNSISGDAVVTETPEPGSLLLLATVFIGVVVLRRRFRAA